MPSPNPQTIEIVAGTPPGGGQDRAARALADAIESTGRSVTVTNLVGRGGGDAWESVAGRAGERSVISISSPTLVSNLIVDDQEPGGDDLTHLAILCTEPLVFVVAGDSHLSDPSGLLQALERSPESTGVALATALGNVNHIAVTTVAAHLGVHADRLDVTAFSSAAAAVRAVVESEATFAVVSAASALEDIAEARVNALAVSSVRRLGPPLDDVATLTELGFDCDLGTWRGVVAPPRLSPDDVLTWEELLTTAISSESWRDSVHTNAWVPTFMIGDQVQSFVTDQTRSMRAALERLEMIGG